jgi:hypothetical protein
LRETDNTAGMVCNYTVGQGSNSYDVASDGRININLTETAAGSNPPQCPASPPT